VHAATHSRAAPLCEVHANMPRSFELDARSTARPFDKRSPIRWVRGRALADPVTCCEGTETIRRSGGDAAPHAPTLVPTAPGELARSRTNEVRACVPGGSAWPETYEYELLARPRRAVDERSHPGRHLRARRERDPGRRIAPALVLTLVTEVVVIETVAARDRHARDC
jgi:hypothetical protein